MPKAPRRQPQSLKGKTVMTNNLYPHDTGETPGHTTPRPEAGILGATEDGLVDESAILLAAWAAEDDEDAEAGT